MAPGQIEIGCKAPGLCRGEVSCCSEGVRSEEREATEGETLKRRYKIIRIGPTSILIEDLDAKRQQSLPLTEENAG